ncbi:MAG: hypothetical protein ABGX31_02700 [bacterium]
MSKIMISQSIMWAAAIIVTALSSEFGSLWVTISATMALGALKAKNYTSCDRECC